MKTKRKILKLAVLGDPVAHSLSPLMHNASLRAQGLPFRYEKIRVPEAELKGFFKKEALGFYGFNLTIPLKEAVLPLLDALSPQALRIGAVNTVLRRNGRWIGFNTDGEGYIQSLPDRVREDLAKRRVVLLGAGGSARALAFALAERKPKALWIHNRSLERAQNLKKDVLKYFPKLKIVALDFQNKSLRKTIGACDLLINTTRLSLDRASWDFFPWERLNPSAWVSDIVYQPLRTDFLKAAEAQGHSIHSGEGMLLYQGVLAYEIWTGRKPEIETMREALLGALGGG